MASDHPNPTLLVVAGVSGSGKSTLGAELAKRFGVQFIDGDDFHPQSSLQKMGSGVPLDDSDREPWLRKIRQTALNMTSNAMAPTQNLLDKQGHGSKMVVIACSALKQKYRDILRGSVGDELDGASETGQPRPKVHFIILRGTRELIKKRIESRQNHFMAADMLQSQFETWEEPDSVRENTGRGVLIPVELASADGHPKPVEILVNEVIQELATKAQVTAPITPPSSQASSGLLPPWRRSLLMSQPDRLLEILGLLFEVSGLIERKLVPELQRLATAGCESYEELIDHCQEIVRTRFDQDEKAQFLASHPRIGETKGLSKLSSKEQGSQTEPAILARLEELNTIYENSYPGLRYVTFVNGRTRAEIVREMEQVLRKELASSSSSSSSSVQAHQKDSLWNEELEKGIANIFKIARSRLKSISQTS